MRFNDLEADTEWKWSAYDLDDDINLEIHITPKEENTAQARQDRVVAFANFVGPFPETNRAELGKLFGRELGFSPQQVASIIKTKEEVAAEQQQQAQDAAAAEAQKAGAVQEATAMSPSALPSFQGADINQAVGGIPAEGAGGGTPAGEGFMSEILDAGL